MSDDVRDAYPEPDDTAHHEDHLDEGKHDGQGDDMDEPRADPGTDQAPDAPDLRAVAPGAEIEHTGNPVVDSVLDSLRELDQVPVSEHVAVFEAAHDRLRGALADAGEPPADS